ncbi:hypothetical protein DIURU_002752 [Diutina rugosa]|uniref:Interferon-related developmental regulator N-terminal domain-containing protein n=1 Tax=Diutina rugosa TaxID=5481 RepID=A0A642UQU1_DIURU|nr:uncharacterized protein DIURU_002752 [Diutina rugosa]KAA8902643.1 hypothetical protein DIURU_002752 [Diutina rugosa]
MRDNDDSDDEAVEADFNRIQDLLRKRLESLQMTVENDKGVEKTLDNNMNKNDRKQYEAEKLNKARIKSEATSPNEIINSLQQSRTDVSTTSREILLAHLYQVLVSKSVVVWNEEHMDTSGYVSDVEVEKLIKVLLDGDYRTDVELYYLVRSVVALIVSDIDEFGTFVNPQLLQTFQKLVTEGSGSVVTAENKATIVNGLVNMTLVLHHGSSNFGLDDTAKWLMDLAEGFATSAFNLRSQLSSGDREYSTLITDKHSDDKLVSEAVLKVNGESAVAVAALHGLATVLTLLSRGEYLNELVEDFMLKLVPLVDNDADAEIAKAAARVVAVIYEVYTYGEDDDADDDEYNTNAPYYEQEQLFAIFDRLANLSTKKVSKKDRKSVHSVFRNILNSMKAYTNPVTRAELSKRSPEGMEIINASFPNVTLRLSKYKSWPIDTWGMYSRLRSLKWCFSFGLHHQLVASESLRDILKDDVSHHRHLEIDESRLDDAGYTDLVDDALSKMNEMNDKQRAEKRRRDRDNKFHENMGDFADA